MRDFSVVTRACLDAATKDGDCLRLATGIYVGKRLVGSGPALRVPQHKSVPRLVYQYTYGPVPYGRHVYRRCRNKECIAPDHLVLDQHGEQSAILSRLPKRAPDGAEYVYRLYCPETGRTRYIGATVDPCERMQKHILGKQPSLAEWVASLRDRGLFPRMAIICGPIPADRAFAMEASFIADGAAILLNRA